MARSFDNAHKVIQDFVTFKAKEQLAIRLRNMLIKKSIDATEESNSDEDDDKDPMKDQFLNKLSAMNEKVKIYNEAFYDREPRYMHVSPQLVLSKAQNKTK